MKIRKAFIILAAFSAFAVQGCGGSDSSSNTPTGNAGTPNAPKAKMAAALPDEAFKAQISAPGAPTQLKAGQKASLQVHVKNASNVQWYALGGEVNTSPDNKFYLSVGNRWLDSTGKLITDMDGRHGLTKDLKPGEETEVPLQITAPKNPGNYILELDVVQEQVVWFHVKGSPMARVNIKVE
jgi:hypothetical protein